MKKKTCVITGANAGIGKQATIQILKKGFHVVMACRNKARGNRALEEIKAMDTAFSVEMMLVDMGLKQSIRAFAAELHKRFSQIDVLIHNAAIFNITRKNQEKTEEGIETVWAVNHLGPVFLTSLVQDLLAASGEGRIITIASKGLIATPMLKVHLEDPEFNKRKYSIVKAYYQSKRAQIMYTYWLAEKLEGTPVSVNCIRVPAVQVDLNRHKDLSRFMKWVYSIKAKKALTPEQAAQTYTYLATTPEFIKVTGQYFNEKNQRVLSNRYTRNRENIKAVMDLTWEYLSEKENKEQDSRLNRSSFSTNGHETQKSD